MTNSCSFKAPMVTLADGRQVASDTREWRAECEARAVLNMRNKMHRYGYLLRVEARRGKEARDRLYSDVIRLHRLNRQGMMEVDESG